MGIIGVIGGSQVSSEIYRLAYEVGREIGKRGHILVNGGLSGVMEASAKGAKEEGGLVVGILPGHSKESANPWVDIPVVTGMGEARNVIIVRTSDVLIAIDGRYGTLSEIAFALVFGKPVIGLRTWECDFPIIRVETPGQAVEEAEKFLK
ncbi:TIGR00725 family protein [bacterium]|nr:MAG: TIGR00725 family protein [bacterium]